MNTKVDISGGNVSIQTDGKLTVSAASPIPHTAESFEMLMHKITDADLKRLKKKHRYEVSKEYGMYIVEPGDTLHAIGVGVGHPWRVLAEFNKLENPDLIFPGQVIKLR